ncbi:MAG: glycosyltransferase family 4 protein [Waltera sp.]
MKIYIYKGGLSLVAKSGVGSAIRHQEKMLRAAKVTVTDVWKEADIVQINTVLPDSPLMARRARRQGKKVVYYGHSTMEDFKNSFIGSNLAAPLFKKWIRHCYRQGDVVITPTEYSRKLLMKYDLHREIYALTNGVDTEFFHKTEQAGGRFRIFFHLPVDKKVVISAGHLIHRKGIEDFLEMAKRMPDIIFLWFGGGNNALIPAEIKKAVAEKPENVIFAGFQSSGILRDAYCGADAFAFFSYEETEGIVVLEALSCEIPVIVRDIPVYEGWLTDGEQVRKADESGFLRAGSPRHLV